MVDLSVSHLLVGAPVRLSILSMEVFPRNHASFVFKHKDTLTVSRIEASCLFGPRGLSLAVLGSSQK